MSRRHQASGKNGQKEEQPPCRLAKFTILADTAAVAQTVTDMSNAY
jgi:hypothetical protein